MQVNRSSKNVSAVRKKASDNQPIPHSRVIVVVAPNGKILHSRVVLYNGEGIGQYYRSLSDIENELASKYRQISHPHRIYSGTASNVGSFLSLFPEVTSPFSAP